MSSSSTTPNNDSGMLGIGQQCEHETCMMVDFLPFTCSHCKHKYCLDHFQPDAHSCSSFDPAAHDRVAPNCPLCNTPVAIPIGEDPNSRMERHFASECNVFLGELGKKRAAASKMPVCGARTCHKKLFAPIQCPGCKQKFCAEHRYAADHACPSEAAKTSIPASASSATRPAPQAAAALAALKRNIASATAKPTRTAAAPKPAPASKAAPAAAPPKATSAPPQPTPAPKNKPHNPFSKTDRCEPLPNPAHTSSQSVPHLPTASVSSPPAVIRAGTVPSDWLDDPLLGSWAPPRRPVS